jgi:hypothetical protein
VEELKKAINYVDDIQTYNAFVTTVINRNDQYQNNELLSKFHKIFEDDGIVMKCINKTLQLLKTVFTQVTKMGQPVQPQQIKLPADIGDYQPKTVVQRFNTLDFNFRSKQDHAANRKKINEDIAVIQSKNNDNQTQYNRDLDSYDKIKKIIPEITNLITIFEHIKTKFNVSIENFKTQNQDDVLGNLIKVNNELKEKHKKTKELSDNKQILSDKKRNVINLIERIFKNIENLIIDNNTKYIINQDKEFKNHLTHKSQGS